MKKFWYVYRPFAWIVLGSAYMIVGCSYVGGMFFAWNFILLTGGGFLLILGFGASGVVDARTKKYNENLEVK